MVMYSGVQTPLTIESRIPLSIGGDDITEFLYVLLDKINFPYKELNLARSYDWNVMEDLKERICTLQEVSVSVSDVYLSDLLLLD